jgi:Domain of unknown function (DUF397)
MQPDQSRAVWFKASASNGQGGSCVEVCLSQPGIVGIRDSKNVPGPELIVSDQSWSQFIQAVMHGEFDL